MNIIFITYASGQSYPVEHYTMQDGLSHSNVYRIFQDKRGFLWFCTANGLSSFNGKTFRNYYTEDGLTGSSVMSVSEDASGNKLVSTSKNGICFLTDTSLRRYPITHGDTPGRVLYAMNDGKIIWLIEIRGGAQSLSFIKDHSLVSLNVVDDSHQNVLFNKIVTFGDSILFATSAGIYKPYGERVLPFLKNIVQGNVLDLEKDNEGNIWVGLTNRILHIKNDKIVETYLLKDKQTVSNILIDRNKNVWVALAGDGVLLIKNKKLENITARLSMHKAIINDLYQDAEGDVWIATYGEGIYKVNSLDVLEYYADGQLLNNYITSLSKVNDSSILIGSIGKISVWKNGTIIPLLFKLINPDAYIYNVSFSKDKVYAATPLGLYTKNMLPPFHEEIVGGKNNVGALAFCIGKDSTWIGGYSNLAYVAHNKLLLNTDTALTKKRYNAIMRDSKGNIWLGTDSGIMVYDGKQYRNYRIDGSATQNCVNAICEDIHKRIWFATGGGLVRMENGRTRIFTTADGLPNNLCNAIAEDGNDFLWVGTINGLCYIDLSTDVIRSYKIANANEILSLCCINNNTLFVGTSDRLSVIQTDNVYSNSKPPPVYITLIKTERSKQFMPVEASFPFNENKLFIEFAGISYKAPEKIEYRYKIQNLDDAWHITKNNSVELSALPSGDYSFVLNARYEQGQWSPDVTLPIHISTPFWRNTSYITLFAFICAAAIFFISRQVILRKESKKRQQLLLYNKVIYLKQQAFSALINPHFIFNSMNSIQHYLNKKDNDLANAYLADFASLIRMTMEDAQEAFITLNKEITRIRLYLMLEQLRFGEGLRYEVFVDPLLSSNVRIPNMLLQPYVENAIWHGIMPKGEGSITLRFVALNESNMKVEIIDDGVGFKNDVAKAKNDKKHASFGMKLSRQRLDYLNKLLDQYYSVTVKERLDENNNIIGTIVEIVLPVDFSEHEMTKITEELNN